MRVLLVEDDPAIAEALIDGLPRYGFEVTHVTTATEARAEFTNAKVVLLDLGLPDDDGIVVCRDIRAVSEVPLLIITARSTSSERAVGLELGADDYLSKPFGLRELVARIRAVLRRTTQPGALATSSTTPMEAIQQSTEADLNLIVGTLRVEPQARRAYVSGTEISLTPKEFDLLATLASKPGMVFGREELMNEVWDQHWFGSTRTLDVHIGALRRKLAAAVDVQTVRGVGFRLEKAAQQ